MGVELPGEADTAVDLDVLGAARRKASSQKDFATSRPASRKLGAVLAATHQAKYAADARSELEHHLGALCLIAWNEPIGRANWTRYLA